MTWAAAKKKAGTKGTSRPKREGERNGRRKSWRASTEVRRKYREDAEWPRKCLPEVTGNRDLRPLGRGGRRRKKKKLQSRPCVEFERRRERGKKENQRRPESAPSTFGATRNDAGAPELRKMAKMVEQRAGRCSFDYVPPRFCVTYRCPLPGRAGGVADRACPFPPTVWNVNCARALGRINLMLEETCARRASAETS